MLCLMVFVFPGKLKLEIVFWKEGVAGAHNRKRQLSPVLSE